MREVAFIGFFGLLGVFSRYGIDLLLSNSSQNFPINTFLINILGCFIAGCIYSFGQGGALSSALQLGLLVGFCGGFTTFSAYSLQAFQLMDSGKMGVAITYLLISPLAGLVASFAGVYVSKRVLF